MREQAGEVTITITATQFRELKKAARRSARFGRRVTPRDVLAAVITRDAIFDAEMALYDRSPLKRDRARKAAHR